MRLDASISRLIFILWLGIGSSRRFLPKEAYQTVSEIIKSAGYPVEKHRVVTSDGYILQLHRIPSGRRIARKAEPSVKSKNAVLIGHGLCGHSGDFVIRGPEKSLAYLLADADYDVWLANWRGNYYTAHQHYKRSDPQFWNFTIQEHGIYDLPATIDKVLNITKLPKLLYVGFSMGTTISFITLAERPEYNDKLIANVALAPVAYLANVLSVLGRIFKKTNIFELAHAIGINSVSFTRDIIELALKTVCSAKSVQNEICINMVYMLVGEDMEQYDPDAAVVMFARVQSMSMGEIEHFYKMAYTDVFTAWENGLHGSVRPYNLDNIKVPVTLVYAENDKLIDKYQVFRLAEKLNSTGVLEDLRPATSWHKFNHFDFLYAKDVGKLCNIPLARYIGHLFDKYGIKNNRK